MVDGVIIGLAASIIGLAGFVPYIFGILNRRTIPHKVSWLVWSALGILTAASYYASGARESALLPVANAFAHVVVAGLSLKYGTGGWSRTDKMSIIGAVLGLVLWAFTNEPFAALLVTIIVEAIGAVPTVLKTFHNPQSEDRLAWSLFLVANFLNLLAVGSWTLSIASYPVYSFGIALLMNALTWELVKQSK